MSRVSRGRLGGWITAVVGGQFGSEGKGAIVGHLAGKHDTHVRVGAANAGHTVYTCRPGEGEPVYEKHVMQQLPCAAYCNPHATLVLGPGALISPAILEEEMKKNLGWRAGLDMPGFHLIIDPRAHVVTDQHIFDEQEWDLEASIGSTSTIAREGIGAAQASRAARVYYKTAEEYFTADWLQEWAGHKLLVQLADTAHHLHEMSRNGGHILLEGTQGTSLSNTTGFYPFVTSRNVTASGLAADCGLGPKDIDQVIMVCRSYPIRVAGNSGPFWADSAEINWQTIGIDQERERTTVTKKVRRVATMSYDQLVYNARLNSATHLALTFADYLNPEFKDYRQAGVVSPYETDGWEGIGEVIRTMEGKVGLPVSFIGTGPASIINRGNPITYRN